MTASFDLLWLNHPYPGSPCAAEFPNQCAIRMGVALERSGVDMSSFPGARCWHGHRPGHILRAQELADWLSIQGIFGPRTVFRKQRDLGDKRGIVFVQNGWGSTDHIDLWDGPNGAMRAGSPDYLERGNAIWLWIL